VVTAQDLVTNAVFVRQNKAEEDATFYLIKDGTLFSPLLCLTNLAHVCSNFHRKKTSKARALRTMDLLEI
jgi:hypothetical protein